MNLRKILKRIHMAGTLWFILCVGYILIFTLLQAGFGWWLIFPLGGYSAVFLFLFLCLYLFAFFRGIDHGRQIPLEHPLTSSSYYIAFYDMAPLIGALAGWIGMAGLARPNELLLGIAYGTLGTTFLVWIIIDPAIGMIEKILPMPRKNRLERLEHERQQRHRKEQQRKSRLRTILHQEEMQRRQRQEQLLPYAQRLVEIIKESAFDLKHARNQAMQIGVVAWQMGGINCMQQLHEMTLERIDEDSSLYAREDFLGAWWDGIGNWRYSSQVQ